MQLICCPDIHKESTLPVYVTGIGVDTVPDLSTRSTTRYPHIIMTVSGRGSCVVDGEVYELTPGRVFYADRDVEYMMRPSGANWKVNWVMFEYGLMLFAESLFTSSRVSYFSLHDTEDVSEVFRSIYDAISLDNFYGGFTASALLYQLIIRLNRDVTMAPEQKVNPAVAAILTYINEHYAEEITLEKLCKAAGGLSEQYLCRLFKQTMGMRPVEYILKKRINIAHSYLEKTDMPIAEVAERTGFHNTSYFYRNFKKFTGTSPLHCRQAAVGITHSASIPSGV